MRKAEEHACVNKLACALATLFICAAAGSMALAAGQFRLPKLPKLPGKKQTEPATKPSKGAPAGPAPEVSAITPDAAPPGGMGGLVLTGKNFTPGMRLKLTCEGGEISTKSFKVESAERATVELKVPFDTKEGPCSLELVRFQGAGGKEGETDESAAGTPEVFQVPAGGPTFRISKAGKLPVGMELVLIAEGDMDFMAMMQKVVQETQGGFGAGKMKKGQLLLAPDSVKYTQEDKTIFSESPSGVKSVDEMTMMGEPTGVFRVVFASGKIYNFQSPGGDKEKGHEQYTIVKARLGK